MQSKDRLLLIVALLLQVLLVIGVVWFYFAKYLPLEPKITNTLDKTNAVASRVEGFKLSDLFK